MYSFRESRDDSHFRPSMYEGAMTVSNQPQYQTQYNGSYSIPESKLIPEEQYYYPPKHTQNTNQMNQTHHHYYVPQANFQPSMMNMNPEKENQKPIQPYEDLKSPSEMKNWQDLEMNENKMPVLKLQVTEVPGYDLDVDDVKNLFSRFGRVTNVFIKNSFTGYIVYNDMMSALFAQRSLDRHYLKDINVRLYVSTCNPDKEDLTPEELNQFKSLKNQNQDFKSFLKASRPLPNLPLDVPALPYVPVKFTAKYEIQIENEKTFQVAKRIIGPRGLYMKSIIGQCQGLLRNNEKITQGEFLKLRLRGKGSGFLEGPQKRECQEPMHLCVSSKYFEVYNLACKYVEELLQKVYQDYEEFCLRNGYQVVESLNIKRFEDINETDQTAV